MDKYETFNPTLPPADDFPPAEGGERDNITTPHTEKRVEKKKKRKKQSDSAAGGERKVTHKEKAKEEVKSVSDPLWPRIVAFFKSPHLRILFGIFLGCVAVYLLVSFISYIPSCIKDQSVINSTAIGSAGKVSNAGGEGGARLAEFLINECFGVGSIVIIFWLGAISLKMLAGWPRFKTVDFTIKCFVALITLSLIVGLITLGTNRMVNLGGYHGRYVNEFIIHFVGWIGAWLLCLFLIALFIVICLRDLVNWLLRLKHERDERRRKLAEVRAAEKAREDEIKRMQNQEKIDDLKAGESAPFDSGAMVGLTDASPESYMEFTPEDAPLYNLDVEEGDEVRPEFRTTPLSPATAGYSAPGDAAPQGQGVPSPLYDSTDDSVANAAASVAGDDGSVSGNGAGNGDDMPVGEDVPAEENIPEEDTSEAEDFQGDTPAFEGDEGSGDGQFREGGNSSEGGESPDGVDSSAGVESSDGVVTPAGGDTPMVVNVNQISQSDKKHYTSEVDRYEDHKYKFPPFDLLRPGKEGISVDAEEQAENKERIKKTLMDFGIPIISIEATVGPTVTLYEIVPDKGVKIARIRSLVDDLALSLAASSGVRIIAPIPGKGSVGIEVPNKDPQMVSMRTVIQSQRYQNSKYHLPVAIGSTISNEVYMADLAKMPHLLVAGATGQGKSVGLNAIIASLLYCMKPYQLKFVMIDPKQVEFSLYNKIKDHYLAMIPDGEDESGEVVITDMEKVEATLNSLCIEMDNRYSLLKAAFTRNIEEYNEKIKKGQLNPAEGHRFLPYIVVVVDEFGDLVMVAGKNVETPIARLAQKARAVGMHVIIATQRPSTNVITGIIKANFPARISFKVSSGIDSKTILDASGAQHLIGRGDMLIFHNSEMVRVQCAFIDTPEVEAICDYISRQPYPQGPYILPEPKLGNEGDATAASGASLSETDPLLPEIARQVVSAGFASTSAVQRQYSIGYNRAGRIMDQLESLGIVGAASGGKPRQVLADSSMLEDILATLGK